MEQGAQLRAGIRTHALSITNSRGSDREQTNRATSQCEVCTLNFIYIRKLQSFNEQLDIYA